MEEYCQINVGWILPTRAGADVIMFDNMSADMMKKGIKLIAGRARTEASGGIRLDTIREKAESGIDVISVGRMTQSAPAVDIGRVDPDGTVRVASTG